jgi:hypothetical protein
MTNTTQRYRWNSWLTATRRLPEWPARLGNTNHPDLSLRQVTAREVPLIWSADRRHGRGTRFARQPHKPTRCRPVRRRPCRRWPMATSSGSAHWSTNTAGRRALEAATGKVDATGRARGVPFMRAARSSQTAQVLRRCSAMTRVFSDTGSGDAAGLKSRGRTVRSRPLRCSRVQGAHVAYNGGAQAVSHVVVLPIGILIYSLLTAQRELPAL